MEILELKKTITDIKISVDVLNDKKKTKDKKSEMKDRTLEITQLEKQKRETKNSIKVL